MSEFYTINRYVLLIRPGVALIEWVNSVYPEAELTYENQMSDENTTVYLIPEMNDLEDAYDWLKDNYLAFFENTLEDLYDEPDDWPEVMDWAAFERMIDFSIQTDILDIVSEEEDDDYREEYDDDDDDEVDGFPAEDDIDWN